MAYMPALWHLDGLGVVLGVRVADSFTRALNDAAVRNAKPGSKAFKLADGGGLFPAIRRKRMLCVSGVWMTFPAFKTDPENVQ